MKAHAQQSGFSLIELMIAVAIVGILAAIAFPSYRQYVVRGNRADAQAELLANAQGMERFFVANNSYLGAATGGADTGAPTVGHTQSPETGTAIYNITIAAATQTPYSLRATPVGAQASDGYLGVDNTGARVWDKNNNGSIDSGESTWNK